MVIMAGILGEVVALMAAAAILGILFGWYAGRWWTHHDTEQAVEFAYLDGYEAGRRDQLAGRVAALADDPARIVGGTP